MITVTEVTDKQVNAAILSLDADMRNTKQALQSQVDSLKSSLDESKAGLQSGATYDISISGNAATASRANYASSAGTTSNAATAGTANSVAGALSLQKTSVKADETTAAESYNGSANVSQTIYSPDQSVNQADDVLFDSVNYQKENVVAYDMTASKTMTAAEVVNRSVKLTGALTADATLTLYFNATGPIGRKSWYILNECTTANAKQSITITTGLGTSVSISVKKNQASYVTDLYVDAAGNVLPFASTGSAVTALAIPPVGSYLQMPTDPSSLYSGTTWTNAGAVMTAPNWGATVDLLSYTSTWYTVPSAGWVLVSGTDPWGVNFGVYISTDSGTTSKYIEGCFNDMTSSYTKGGSATIPVAKGNSVKFNPPENGPNRYCIFIPCKLELYSWVRTA